MTPLAILVLACGVVGDAPARPSPNIVYILADDLGYGDLRAICPGSKLATPRLDRLAEQGMVFTDAHSGSAVCSPTRYGILTGRYSWRSKLKSGVLGGYSRRLIEPGRLTVPSLLKQHGYRTVAIGKWHLGMDWPLKAGGFATDYPDAWKVDYSVPIVNGPMSVGFDSYFGISASLDMPPYVYIKNDQSLGLPTVEKTWIRKGPAHEDFEAIDVLPRLTREAIAFLDQQTKTTPFFLYMPLAAPHTPILPTDSWRGKSGINDYGDFVMQVDAAIGEVLDALERTGLAENTLVIVTSDNGCAPVAKIDEMIAKGHYPSGPLRGHKADIFEGGHRVPMIVRWPGHVKPGTRSDRLVGLMDLMATCAEIVGAKLPDGAGEDSVSILPTLRGQDQPPRLPLVHHSANGSFAIRQGPWKLAFCPDSGGWSIPRPGTEEARKLPDRQLYNLSDDLAETKNLLAQYPDVVARLTKTMQTYATSGRSTTGEPQKNEGPINFQRLKPANP